MRRPALALSLCLVALVVLFVVRADRTTSDSDTPQNVAHPAQPDATTTLPATKPTRAQSTTAFRSSRATPSLPKPTTVRRRRTSFRAAIRDQLKAAEPALTKCLQAHRGEPGVNGKAALTFIIARNSNEAPILETTGVDFDQSSVTNELLLGCLKRTAAVMAFDAIPDGVDAVSIGRTVVIEDGVMTEHRFTEYANLRDR